MYGGRNLRPIDGQKDYDRQLGGRERLYFNSPCPISCWSPEANVGKVLQKPRLSTPICCRFPPAGLGWLEPCAFTRWHKGRCGSIRRLIVLISLTFGENWIVTRLGSQIRSDLGVCCLNRASWGIFSTEA